MTRFKLTKYYIIVPKLAKFPHDSVDVCDGGVAVCWVCVCVCTRSRSVNNILHHTIHNQTKTKFDVSFKNVIEHKNSHLEIQREYM